MRTHFGRLLLLSLPALAAAVAAARSGSPFLSPAPPALSSGVASREPALVFEPADLDLGRIAPGRERTAEVAWRRAGPGELRVRAVKPGCGCLRVEGLDGRLAAGARGALRVLLAPRSEPGPFLVPVRAFTDAPPPADVAVVRVSGFVGDEPVARPAVVDLGARSPGARVARRVEVSLPPGGAGAAVRAAAALEGLAGEAATAAPILAGRLGPDVLVTVVAPEGPGPFAGRLVVTWPPLGRVEVPVRGIVVAPKVAPEVRREGGGPPAR